MIAELRFEFLTDADDFREGSLQGGGHPLAAVHLDQLIADLVDFRHRLLADFLDVVVDDFLVIDDVADLFANDADVAVYHVYRAINSRKVNGNCI